VFAHPSFLPYLRLPVLLSLWDRPSSCSLIQPALPFLRRRRTNTFSECPRRVHDLFWRRMPAHKETPKLSFMVGKVNLPGLRERPYTPSTVFRKFCSIVVLAVLDAPHERWGPSFLTVSGGLIEFPIGCCSIIRFSFTRAFASPILYWMYKNPMRWEISMSISRIERASLYAAIVIHERTPQLHGIALIALSKEEFKKNSRRNKDSS